MFEDISSCQAIALQAISSFPTVLQPLQALLCIRQQAPGRPPGDQFRYVALHESAAGFVEGVLPTPYSGRL